MFRQFRCIQWPGVFFLLAFFLFPATGCKQKSTAPKPPPEVLYLTVSPTNVPVIEEWIGTSDGFVNAQIRAQVTGYLLTQNYPDGALVKKGELLFQIDPRPFQAAFDQALSRLAQDKANLTKTELDVKRYTPLAGTQAISEETLVNAVQANQAAQAQVQADEAAVESARLNLSFTRITSPVDGIAGIAQAQIGDLVSQSGNVLTTVSAVNPIKVNFQVSERSYLGFWRRLLDTTNQDLPLQLILADGSIFAQKGRFYSADRQVNPTTGTLQVVGLFANPEYELRPGQYSLVRAQTRTDTNVFFVPQRAVTELQGKSQIAVIGPSNKVQITSVKIGQQIGSDWIIESGLQPGDRVIVEGLQSAKQGTVVNPKPFTVQTNQPPPAAGLRSSRAQRFARQAQPDANQRATNHPAGTHFLPLPGERDGVRASVQLNLLSRALALSIHT